MTLQENDKPHLWQLIKEIRGYRGYSEGEYGFEFVIENRPITLDGGSTSKVADRRDLMLALENFGAIEIDKTVYKSPVREDGYPFWIKILQPKFKEIYNSLEFEYGKSKEIIPKLKPSNLAGCPYFDENKSIIIWDKEECSIPLRTNQHFLCKKMFTAPFGERVKEIEILDLADWAQDTNRSVYDAMLAVNKKIENCFGIKKFFKWKNNHVWVDIKLPNI